MLDSRTLAHGLPKWLAYLLIFGLFLTLRGYHSRDGDQAYRLPLLLHKQSPSLFAHDPFVRAFDAFNPHRGYLTLLDLASRPLGLSTGLAGLFALTFALTCLGLDRLAVAVWPDEGSRGRAGIVAVVLVLIAKAGNIGTNHLFEAMLLDRLIGFALGWVALAAAVKDPKRGWRIAAPLLGVALLIHPSVGLQLTMLLGAGWIGWAIWPGRTSVSWRAAAAGLIALGAAVGPGLWMNLGQGGRLFAGLTPEEFRLLSVELQGPQHMLPHLWRTPQWLAWSCYLVLAVLAFLPSREADRLEATDPPTARWRLAILLAANLAGLALAWVAVERWEDLRITLFQPFRMATVFRGLALVAIAGSILKLWGRGTWADRGRAALLTVGLAGDWALIVATLVELTSRLLEWVEGRSSAWSPGFRRGWRWSLEDETPPPTRTGQPFKRALSNRLLAAWPWPIVRLVVAGGILIWGLVFLARHDTESGHWPILGTLATLAVLGGLLRGRALTWNRRRVLFALAGTWAVPILALAATGEAAQGRGWAMALVDRCRFSAVPVDDIERLAVWCRDHTPRSARFIGPPGPKTFRLWSLRSLAFNRAASPYHAEGLADWSARFRDHVAFDGPADAFVRAYQADRHGLERRYQAMSDADRARLALRQGATHVVAAAPARSPAGPSAPDAASPLELLHVEGRYAIYRVRSVQEVTLRTP